MGVAECSLSIHMGVAGQKGWETWSSFISLLSFITIKFPCDIATVNKRWWYKQAYFFAVNEKSAESQVVSFDELPVI